MLEVRLRHLELLVEKLLAMNLADPSVNWLNFASGLASAVTSFRFNLIVALFGICYNTTLIRNSKIGRGWRSRDTNADKRECNFLLLWIMKVPCFQRDGR